MKRKAGVALERKGEIKEVDGLEHSLDDADKKALDTY
jgi:hypothetical protein